MKPNVGFIGLGEMGKWMSLNIAGVGFPLTVYDIRQEPVNELVKHGASPADSPTRVAEKSDWVFLSLPDTKDVREVIFGGNGMAGNLSSGAIVVDLSTIHYLETLKIADELAAKGITFIDAPVSGMEERAKEATLTVMVGGDLGAVEKVRPILDAIGNNVVYMGKSGNGQLTKLVNQLLFNIGCAAVAEILPMAVKLGLDPETVCNVINTSTGQSWASKFFTPYILKNDFTPGYPLKRAYKDMACAAEISGQEKIPLPVFFAALQTYQLALAKGLGNENKGAMIKVWEKALGVRVRDRGVHDGIH